MKKPPASKKAAATAKAAPVKSERWLINGKPATKAQLEAAQREARKLGRTLGDVDPNASNQKRARAKPRKRGK